MCNGDRAAFPNANENSLNQTSEGSHVKSYQRTETFGDDFVIARKTKDRRGPRFDVA